MSASLANDSRARPNVLGSSTTDMLSSSRSPERLALLAPSRSPARLGLLAPSRSPARLGLLAPFRSAESHALLVTFPSARGDGARAFQASGSPPAGRRPPH